MKMLNLTLLTCLLLFFSCSKEKEANNESQTKIDAQSAEYQFTLEKVLKSNPAILDSQSINELKFKLVSDYLKDRHPLYEAKKMRAREHAFQTFVQEIDPFALIFSEKDLEELMAATPELERNLSKVPSVFISLLQKKSQIRIQELERLSDVFFREKFSFMEAVNFYVGPNAPKATTELQWANNWFNYLGALLVEKAGKKDMNLSQARLQESSLKKEVQVFIRDTLKVNRDLLANPERLVDVYLNALLKQYDDHSTYITPKDYARFENRLNLEYLMLGMRYKVDLSGLKVQEIIPNSPSDPQVKVSDKIIKVKQGVEEASFHDIPKITSILQNLSGEEVELVVLRKGQEVKVKVKPTTFTSPDKELQYFLFKEKDKILAYVKIPQFYYTSPDDVNRLDRKLLGILMKLTSLQVKGLVLDLRDNLGGNFQVTKTILSFFINEGPILQERKAKETLVEKLSSHEALFKEKMVVLINGQSASAAEIIAAALQDTNRALVVGEKSYGKGTIQEVIDFPTLIKKEANLQAFESQINKIGRLKLTRASFHRLDGSPVHNHGITPDIEIITPAALGKKVGTLSFPSAKKLKERVPAKTEVLKANSLTRQNKHPSFQLISQLNSQAQAIKENDYWLFSDLTKLTQAKEDINNFNVLKEKIKTKNFIELVTEDNNTSGEKLFKLINTDPVAGESIHILRDYLNP